MEDITGIEGIEQAYKTGQGKAYVRGKTSIEQIKGNKEAIIVTEIPFMVNKARMLERIAELVKDKKLEGIGEIEMNLIKMEWEYRVKRRSSGSSFK